MRKYYFITILFFCTTTILAKNSLVESFKNTAIYWDASLSQKDKNINKEFEFLDAYFKAYPNSKVKLVVFNTAIVSTEDLEVKQSNWSSLKNKLKEVVYDGASDFSLVNTDLSEEMLLFFTDGHNNFGKFEASLYSPRIVTISSKLDIDKKFLHKTAFYNSGYYVNLLESDISSSIKAIKEEAILPKLEFVTEKSNTTAKKYIEGSVTDESKGIPNVNITVNEKNRGTITDQYGRYKIAVDIGDILVFSTVNMKKAVIEVGEEDIINVKLTPTINELDPAIIKSKKSDKPEMVKIGDREVNIKAIGYAVQSVSSEEIKGETKLGLGEAIAGKIAGVKVGSSGNAGDILIRGINSIQLTSHPFFIVDGVPLPQSEIGWDKANYDFIDPNNIADITVLKGLAATNRYGAVGRNGVVLITTKTAGNKAVQEEVKDDKAADIEYRIYESPLSVVTANDSSFITLLHKFSKDKKSYEQYLRMQQSNKNNITFFIESSDYFFGINKPDIGLRVLSNLIELFPNDTSVLKILAFNLEKHSLFDQAEYVYKQIITISPTLSQTYLDLANTYFEGQKYQESVNHFKNITANKISEIETFKGLDNQITNDFRNLLSKRNQRWKINNVDQRYFMLPKYDLRVVTEWSHPQTEFELQYINSKKQYFTLTHTQEENKKRMQEEIKEGFTSDEYILSNIEAGEWFLNILTPVNYIPDLTYPKFLKVKVYTKFGSPDQKLQTHIINLDRVNNGRIFTSFNKGN
ncbi:TonB-dependent receptor plug domain-containing protein [Aquimarina sediminis]|uniref:TonB-dependent receptor plug domain-containing protein n=1 Tax=Aquimarina sediminis TaxID=2070536 RepID=UPI000CA00F3F|nr:TonB-dependent receptor plug domain-containing protein [Aquimarina sediminis]